MANVALRRVRVPVEQDSDATAERPRHRDLPPAEQRNLLPSAQAAHRDRRKLGVEILGDREDRARHVLRPDPVALDEDVEKLARALDDPGAFVFLHRRRAAHAARGTLASRGLDHPPIIAEPRSGGDPGDAARCVRIGAMKRLIVNADDFGRTAGVSAGVLRAHRRGIVTSCTAMVTEGASAAAIREAAAGAPRLALGLHFVLTGGGEPASPASAVPNLAPGGRFRRRAADLPAELPSREIRGELEAQLAVFASRAGRPPTHVDTHHHVALHSSVAAVLADVARERGLPARAPDDECRRILRSAGVRTPDRFIGSFYAGGASLVELERVIDALLDGTTELMCHPGFAGDDLRRTSEYADEREREVEILCDPGIRDRVDRLGIRLIGYDAL